MTYLLPRTRWLALALVFATAAPAVAQFTPGQLAVLRVGDGSAALTNASTPVFIDQFTLLGTPGGPSVTIPTTGANAVTVSGTATSEGFMSLALNGQSLVFGGYNTAPGVASVATTDATVTLRTVVRVSSTGAVATSNLPNSFNGSNIRSAVSTNGTDIWVAGNAGTGLGATGGTRYHAFGSGAATQLSSTTTNNRVVTIFGNQLYVSSATGAFQGLSTFGPGLPMTSGQTLTLLPGFPTAAGPSPYGHFGLDNPLNPVAGIDTFYVADDSAVTASGGLQRWVSNGTTWSLTGTVAPGTVGLRGLTGSVAGNTVTLYGTSAEASANRLVSISDVLTASGGAFNPAGFATLATAGANTVFRGASFTPVPEPAHILLVSAAGTWLLCLARRRKPAVTDNAA